MTRREAKVARLALVHFRRAQDTLGPDARQRPFADATVAAIEAALTEYQQRSWAGRLLPQPAGHRTRLRDWMLELKGYAEARIAELPPVDDDREGITDER